jgi:hypothetical protein
VSESQKKNSRASLAGYHLREADVSQAVTGWGVGDGSICGDCGVGGGWDRDGVSFQQGLVGLGGGGEEGVGEGGRGISGERGGGGGGDRTTSCPPL